MATAGNMTHVAFGTSGSETNISSYLNSAELSQTVDELESTTFGDSDKEFIPGLKERDFSFEGDWDATIDGILAPLLGVAGKSIVFGPAGNTAGMVKYSAAAWLKEYPIASSVGDKVTLSGAIRVSGAVTRGTF